MVSDQEIAKGVETVLRQADPNAVTSLNGVVKQLEAKLGLSLSHKAGFIADHINLLLGSNPTQQQQQQHSHSHQQQPKDHFFLQRHVQHPQFHNTHPQFHSHFAFQQQQPQHIHPNHCLEDLNFRSPLPPPPHIQSQPQPSQPQPQPQPLPNPQPAKKLELNFQNATASASASPKESAPARPKRRGGPGGLNKVCGVSTELQAIVGQSALPRTEIVKQLWVYIRKNNLQDPNNKRKIVCDNALRLVLETDSTDMFKMNKLLAKHIYPLEPTKVSSQAKRLKAETQSVAENTETSPPPATLSEALIKFLGTGETEMHQSEAVRRVWEYIKINHLEDPHNQMAIYCDAKLQELFGCDSISALGISEMLERNHLLKQ